MYTGKYTKEKLNIQKNIRKSKYFENYIRMRN